MFLHICFEIDRIVLFQMELEDIEYIATTIANLAGTLVRIYKGNEKVFSHSLVLFPKDPVIPYLRDIQKIEKDIGYFLTPSFQYYGFIRHNDYEIILGPSHQEPNNPSDLRKLAFECDVPNEEVGDFIAGMNALTAMPLNSFLEMLCAIHFALNKEKVYLKDLAIYEEEQEDLSKEMEKRESDSFERESFSMVEEHNTFDMERTILEFVRRGDLASFKEWLMKAPAAHAGPLADSALRQWKNTFIVTATLVSRSAIRGGLDRNEALTLSDSYIQRCELLRSVERLQNLQFHMLLDYTERVERLHLGKNPSKLIKEVANYVQKHLYEPISIEALSHAVFMSRCHLATRFKEEMGMTLTDYILNGKIDEAKSLLRYTDKPLSTIGGYLGFSSQSHFSNVFRKITKESPKEYRNKHNKMA